MGAKIDMVDISKNRSKYFRQGSVRLSVKAARNCLKKAGLNPDCLGLLINTGIYRDKHIVEPAIATFIQKKIRSNHPKVRNERIGDNFTNSAFSFDLNNGGSGLVSAMEVVNGFIQSGGIQRGMVVTSDAEPFRRLSKYFNFTPAAAAIILSAAADGEGFVKFKTSTFSQYKNSYTSHVAWTPVDEKEKNQNVLHISKKDNYLELCVQLAAQSLNSFLKEIDFHLHNIDLIISSQSPEGFVPKLREQIGLGDRIIEIESDGGELHTAGPAFALDRAWHDGRFHQAKTVIFLCVGSGITITVALYKNNSK